MTPTDDILTIQYVREWAKNVYDGWGGPLGERHKEDFLAQLDVWEADGFTHVDRSDGACQIVTGHETIFLPDGLFGPSPPFSFRPVKEAT